MPRNSDSDSKIGYGKPPKRTRFQKGVSGNPRGRPKGRRNFATVLTEILEEKIIVSEGRVQKTVTKLEATLKKLADKATAGDLIAARLLLALVRSADERAVEPPRKELSEDDLQIMQRVLKRQRSCEVGEADEDQ